MRRWWLVLLLILSLGVNLGVAGMLVYEKTRPAPPEPRPPEVAALGGGGDLIARLPRFANHLGLEGEERRKFLDIQVALFQETTRLRLRMAEIQRSLRMEMTAEGANGERADKLLRESAEVYLQMERAFVRSVFESRRLLGEREERRYLQVLARLRATARGQLGLAAPGEEGGGEGPLLPRGDVAPRGAARPGAVPRDLKPFRELRRQRLLDRLEPPPPDDRGGEGGAPPPARDREGGAAAPRPWRDPAARPAGTPPREMREMRRERMEWRLRQRERRLDARRPPGAPTPPPGDAPPPPVD